MLTCHLRLSYTNRANHEETLDTRHSTLDIYDIYGFTSKQHRGLHCLEVGAVTESRMARNMESESRKISVEGYCSGERLPTRPYNRRLLSKQNDELWTDLDTERSAFQ